MRRFDVIAHHERRYWTYAVPELGVLGTVANHHEVRADARTLIALWLSVPVRTVPFPLRIRYVERPFDGFDRPRAIEAGPSTRRLAESWPPRRHGEPCRC